MDTVFSDLLARRLDGEGPLGVAVSGGGDSVALLYRLAEWGRRPLHVFCVDHGLNPASAEWTKGVAAHAARAGAAFTALHWTGPKPRTGLSAAARRARHALLARAARAAGVEVLCLAHTRDDVAEASWMRAQGSSVGAPAEWAPSPAWPEGRGVFLFRPLLTEARDALRAELWAKGVAWIDDPANADPRSLRARARRADKAVGAATAAPIIPAADMAALLDRSWAAHGLIVLNGDVFDGLPEASARKVLAAAAVCAGGGERLPRGESLDALAAGLDSGRPRTLCGARLWRAQGRIFAVREAGDIGRNGGGRLEVAAGAEAIWDGRYAVRTATGGTISPSASGRTRLTDADRALLARLPAPVRRILPVFDEDFPVPGLSTTRLLGQCRRSGVDCVNWVLPRFMAACGAVDRESGIGPDLAEPPSDCVAKPQTLPI